MLEREKTRRCSANTAKFCGGRPWSSGTPVCMSITPSRQSWFSFPLRRAPKWIGTPLRPIRRLKKGRIVA